MITTLPKNAKIEIKCTGAGLVKLDDFIELQGRLKELSDKSFEKFARELIEDGFSEPISVWLEVGTKRPIVLNGHQRIRTLKKLREMKWDVPNEYPVSYIEADNEKRARRKCLALASQYGEVTDEGLYEYISKSGFDFSIIDDFRFPEIDQEDFLSSFSDLNEIDKESLYTSKIESPIYTPKGPKPKIQELFDTSKYDELMIKIDNSSLLEEEKHFLKLAATRHIRFNYRNVAEYYSHSNKETKEHIEDSALVIIDFNKAIENGFIKLSKGLAEAYDE